MQGPRLQVLAALQARCPWKLAARAFFVVLCSVVGGVCSDDMAIPKFWLEWAHY